MSQLILNLAKEKLKRTFRYFALKNQYIITKIQILNQFKKLNKLKKINKLLFIYIFILLLLKGFIYKFKLEVILIIKDFQ